MKHPWRNFGVLSGLLLACCGSEVSVVARATAGRIGCPADHIDIQDEHGERGVRSWVAACGAQAYVCTSHGALESGHSRVVCSRLDGWYATHEQRAGDRAPALSAHHYR